MADIIVPNSENMPSPSVKNIAWIDIFHGMLISPVQTLGILSNPTLYSPALGNLVGAIGTVMVCALTESCAGASFSSMSELLLNITPSFFANLFFWLILSLFLRQLAALMKIETSIRTCLIVTAWAFLPLIFKATAACFSNATIFGDVLSWLISLWFLILQLFAFESILKLGRLKTLGIMLILPPCLFFTYFISILFASAFLAEGIF